jgi:sterol desaturase/sphingolipid hydroxylase (fatty acid hydroxylase superfamily)
MSLDLTVYAIPAFIVLMLAEGIVTTNLGLRGYERRDTLASLAMGVGNVLIDLFAKALHFAILSAVAPLALLEIGGSWWEWAILLVAADFVYYWFHRLSHEVRFLWAAHVNHHSSQRYNLSTALRQSWTTPFTSLLFWWPLAVVGFSPAMILAAIAINTIYQFWIHSEAIDKLGPLEWVFNTASHHRVHHGTNLEYLDRNHGGMFIVWDRLFGTFEPERAAVRFGLTKNIDTFHPVEIAFHEWKAMLHDVATADSLRARLGFLFRPPGWRPDGASLTTRQMRAAAEADCRLSISDCRLGAQVVAES